MGNDLKTWVEAMVERDATVLHLVPGRVPLARVGGVLEPIGAGAIDTQTFVQALHAVCGENDAGVLHAAAGGGQVLHGRIVSDAGRRTLVVRRLVTPETDREKLGLPDIVWETVAGLKSGLVLVTGEAGSGISTTCAALVASRVADAGVHANITGEPLQWRLPTGNARARISYSLDSADEHMVGDAIADAPERDVDLVCCDPVVTPWTGACCAQAAVQGRLVVASVVGASVSEAIHNMTDPQRADRDRQLVHIARALQLVIHQALVDRADGNGRVLACGVLRRTPAVYNLLREDRAHQLPAMMAVGAKLGMRTLEQHLELLVQEGTVTKAAAIAAHPEPWTARGWLDRSPPATPPPPQP